MYISFSNFAMSHPFIAMLLLTLILLSFFIVLFLSFNDI